MDNFNITGTDAAKEDKHKIDVRAKAKKSLVDFGKLMIPDHFGLSTLAPYQVKMAESLLDPNKRWVCNVLPRGFIKSILGGTAVLYHLYYKSTEEFPEFVMYVSEARPQALDRISFLKYNIQENPRLNYYFGQLMDKKCKDTEAEFTTVKNDRVMGMGAGQKGRGRGTKKGDRFTIILPDDFESEHNTKTQDSRQYIKDWLKGTILPSLDERPGHEGKVWLAGTIVHYDTYLQEILDKWRDAKKEGKESIWHVNFARAEDPIGVPTWKSFFPMSKLLEKRELLGNSKYAQEYLNEARDPTTAVFKVDRLEYTDYSLVHQGGHNYIIHKDMAIPVNTNMGIDVAYKEHEEHDFQVIMPVSKDYLDRIWIGDYVCEHFPLDDVAERAVKVAKEVHPNRVEIEDVGAQGIIKPQMERLQREDKRILRGATIGLRSPRGIKKEDRLQNGLRPYVNGGRMYVKEYMTDLYEQLWHFPKARNDDLLDGIYYAIARLRRPKSEPFPLSELKLKADKKQVQTKKINWMTNLPM